ncbi:hypothetical protein OS493_031436 [Desmophyllum pertusum]|uniref:Uncharacterized protein n=1 Tax=Desmophyllum pertusum TaxID=174260 RepID=A0A9W9ZX31_9CNID|nr:hypothetical protein OS493_031436 [Desmophyllum pertusum]
MANEGMEGCVGGKNVTINSQDISKAQIQCHELVAPCEFPQVAHLPDIQNIRQDQEDGFFSQAFKYLSEDDKQALFDWLVENKADNVVDFLRAVESVKELPSLFTDESQKCTQSMSIDLVPALQARGWPKVCSRVDQPKATMALS